MKSSMEHNPVVDKVKLYLITRCLAPKFCSKLLRRQHPEVLHKDNLHLSKCTTFRPVDLTCTYCSFNVKPLLDFFNKCVLITSKHF